MEFQAIVLAGGKGTRMSDLTSHIPKCLLPIGNKPMIYYPVRMLEKAGFSEINIITFSSIKSKVESELKSNCGIKASLNIVGIDDTTDADQDEDFGTADCLNLLKDKIYKDCMIVSCDLLSNVNIQLMASYFRLNNAAFVMLLSNNLDQSTELSLPGSKGKYSPESDVIGLDLETNRILYINTVDDVEEIEVKKSIAEKYPKITWTTKLQDAHFYIMKKWLVDYLFDNPKKFVSIKSEFIPYIVDKQFSSKKKRLKDQMNNFSSPTKKQSNNKPKPKLFDYVKLDELTNLVNKASGNGKQTLDVLGCFGFIQADGFCFRNNNLAIYAESNRQMMGKVMPYYQRERTESMSKYDRSQVGSDSIVGEGTTLGDKSTIKRSVIGRNCRIGDRVKIINSILMDDIEIDESSTINFSIISNNCKINAKSEFKDCLIGFKQNVAAGKYSNETLQEDDSFMDGY